MKAKISLLILMLTPMTAFCWEGWQSNGMGGTYGTGENAGAVTSPMEWEESMGRVIDQVAATSRMAWVAYMERDRIAARVTNPTAWVGFTAQVGMLEVAGKKTGWVVITERARMPANIVIPMAWVA